MATQLFFRENSQPTDKPENSAEVYLAGGAAQMARNVRRLDTSRGPTLTTKTMNTVAGPTTGLEVEASTGGVHLQWWSDPLNADVTISGSITWNLWASESDMSANVAINGIVEVVDGATGAVTTIDQTARTTEVAITTAAVNNFAETPAAGVLCKRGDRIRVRIFADDAGTMGNGFTWAFYYSGPTAAASGDSYLTFTENLTFVSEPAGTQVFLTNTASAVATADVDREAWTSRGGGVQNDVTNTAAGPTAPLQVTDTAGGTAVSWFTRPLTAFTLGGAARVNFRGNGSSTSTAAAPAIEIAIVDNDGTNPVVWAIGVYVGGGDTWQLPTSEAAHSFLASGKDVAVANNQRLRIRLKWDDAHNQGGMAASLTMTNYYAGSAGATGDTYVTFTQALTEFTGAADDPFPYIGGGYYG